MTTQIKSAKIKKDIINTIDFLNINFSGTVNKLLIQKFKTIKGLSDEIKEHQTMTERLKKEYKKLYDSKRNMSKEEKKYFIETERFIKDKKFIKPRIQAIYNLFGKIVESEEELKDLIKVAKK